MLYGFLAKAYEGSCVFQIVGEVVSFLPPELWVDIQENDGITQGKYKGKLYGTEFNVLSMVYMPGWASFPRSGCVQLKAFYHIVPPIKKA